jgi:LacI family transcriptional regulator
MSLRLNIASDSNKPLVRQIQDDLRQQIANGLLTPGQRLPSMRKLCDDNGVSLGTIKQAINTLTTEGVLGSKSRGGIFVIGPQLQQKDIVLVLPSLQLEQMSRLVAGAQAGLIGKSHRLVIQAANTDYDDQMHLLRYLDKPFVAGVVVCTPGLSSYGEAIAGLIRTGTPCVQVARYIHDVPTDAIIGDGYAMGRIGLNYLLGKGHRHIGIVDTTSDEQTAQDVRKGAASAMQKAGLSFEKLPCVCTSASDLNPKEPWKLGQQAAVKLLKNNPPITAIVGVNPHLALGAYHAVRSLGKSVPSDVSILALENDLTIFQMTQPTISVVDMPLEEMAERSVERLCEIIRQQADYDSPIPNRMVQLSPQLIERQSVAIRK